ncbi:hypothetical protein LTR50_007701 [Elasticomyces elasticus]|nr:hypothetical protein LTR50_007701 [Elasticomyces elasticus]
MVAKQMWNAASHEPPEEQRKRLTRQYIAKGGLREQTVPTSTPMPYQTTTILHPWRTLGQRHLATDPGLVGTVWLRTYYSTSTDALHDSLVSRIDLCNAVDDPDRLLNDSALFSYGSNWSLILDVLPELVVFPPGPEYADYLSCIRAAQDALRRTRVVCSRGLDSSTAPEDVAAMPNTMISDARRLGFSEREIEDMVMKAMESEALKAYVVNYLIVEDEEALRGADGEGKGENEVMLLLVFLDAWGRVVKSKRVDVKTAEMFSGSWLEASWDETGEWEHAQAGEAYRDVSEPDLEGLTRELEALS